jgi:hypothetical protein
LREIFRLHQGYNRNKEKISDGASDRLGSPGASMTLHHHPNSSTQRRWKNSNTKLWTSLRHVCLSTLVFGVVA